MVYYLQLLELQWIKYEFLKFQKEKSKKFKTLHSTWQCGTRRVTLEHSASVVRHSPSAILASPSAAPRRKSHFLYNFKSTFWSIRCTKCHQFLCACSALICNTSHAYNTPKKYHFTLDLLAYKYQTHFFKEEEKNLD